MVDWYEWAVCISASFGIDQNQFAGRLQAYVEKQHQQAIDQDTLVQVLISCSGSERTCELVGTPTTVHNFLCRWAEDERVNIHSPGFPKNPSEMGQQLNRLKQDLLRDGITILDCHFSEIVGVKGMLLIEDGSKFYRPTGSRSSPRTLTSSKASETGRSTQNEVPFSSCLWRPVFYEKQENWKSLQTCRIGPRCSP